MNSLADESCAGPVMRALREAGHDVVAISEVAKMQSQKPHTRKAVYVEPGNSWQGSGV